MQDKNPKPQKIVTVRPNGTRRVQTVHTGKSRTQQQFKDDCNVNKILAKFKATGSITHIQNTQAGVYADLTQMPSYQESLNTVVAAQRAFEEVPAKIRQRFSNDPQEFINFLADEKNNEEAIKLGLKVRPKPAPENPILNTLNNIDNNTKPKRTKNDTSES